MSAILTDSGRGHWQLAGELDFESVVALYARTAEVTRGAATVDLGDVTAANSAAVGLLLEWRREAALRGNELHFVSLPDSVIAIARLSGVQELLEPGRGRVARAD